MNGPHWQSAVDNQWSHLQNATPGLAKDMYAAFRVRPKGYFFDPRFRAKISDGYQYYFDQIQLKILTGLVPYAKQLGFDLPEVVLAEPPPCDIQEVDLLGKDKQPIELNDYQYEAVVRAVQSGSTAFAADRRGVYDHLTAAGKTVEIAALCSAFRTLNVTLTVPTIALLEQTIDELKTMLREPIGQLGGGKQNFEGRIVVAWDGFIKKYARSPFVKNLAFRTQLLLCDELQTVTKLLYPFLRQCTNAYYRYGFSGSFFELDPARIFEVSGYFGATITKVDDQQTMDAGRSVPPSFVFLEYPAREKKLFVDYADAYEQCLVTNDGYNNYMAQQLIKPYESGQTILVIVKRVEHCTRFQEALSRVGIDSDIYNGKINTKLRREMRKQFIDGKLPVLVATEQTIGIGVNMPLIDVLMNAGGGLSDDRTKQKYGRSIRSFDEKVGVTIYEPYLVNNVWFTRHSKARLAKAKEYTTGNVILRFMSGVEHKM